MRDIAKTISVSRFKPQKIRHKKLLFFTIDYYLEYSKIQVSIYEKKGW